MIGIKDIVKFRDRSRKTTKSKSLYHGHCFPVGAVSCAVRWYCRFQLSLRDIEELLFEPDAAQDRHRSAAQLPGDRRANAVGVCKHPLAALAW